LRNRNLVKDSSYVFSRHELVGFKMRAKRRGFWFKALSRLDRALIDLAIEVTDGVRSFRLVKGLQSIIRKAEDTLKSRISRAITTIGIPLAHKLSMLAQKWGNLIARRWISDPSFARFLAIVHVNSLGAFNQQSTIKTG